jgi:transposase
MEGSIMRTDVAKEIKKLKEVEEIVNKSEIARRFGCNRRTVRKYLENDEGGSTERMKREELSILDEFKGTIIEKVDTYGSSAMGVFKFIQKKGYVGGYVTVNNFVKKHKKLEVQKATIRFETTPGLQAQVDWKEKVTMVNKKGEVFIINVFLMVLGYSRLKFVKLTSDKRQETLFECMYEGFKYFSGVPKEVLFDNMKTVIDREESTFKNVVINKKFKSFSKDAGFEVITCRAYRPQTKGKVETLAKLTNRLKAYNEEFENFEELDKIVMEFNEDINNEISQGTKEKPIERFTKEKVYLSPFSSSECLKGYFSKEKEYKVYPDSMINYKGQKYSVPIRFMGKCVKVFEAEDIINIYFDTDLISSHPKSEKFLNYKIDDAKEILKSDALKGYSDESIEDFIGKTLKNMDVFLS